MPDATATVDETTTTTETGTSTTETGKDGQSFDAARAQRTIDTLRAQVEDKDKASKAAARELVAAQTRLKEIDDASKSETEKLASRAQEAGEKLTAAERRAADLAIRLSVERSARKLNFIDEDDAYRLLDRSAVELDAAGEPQNVEKLLADLAKAKPHLVKAEAGTNGQQGTRSIPATPKPATRSQTKDELVAEHEQKLASSGLFGRL